MSLDGPLALWWISAVLAALAIVALGGLARRKTSPRLPIAVLIFSVPVWAVLFAWIAVTFRADPRSLTAIEDTKTPLLILGILGVAALTQAIACVIAAKSARLAASAIAACAIWFVFWVYFVAGMSVSGVWL